MSAPPPPLAPPLPPLLTPAEQAAAAALGEGDGTSGGPNKRRRLPSFKLREIEAEEMELGGVAELLYAPHQQPKRKYGAVKYGADGLPKPKRKPRGFHPYTSSFRGAWPAGQQMVVRSCTG